MIKKTVVITGASRGIGKELACFFSPHFNLALVARSKNELENLKDYLNSKQKDTKILCYAADVSNQSQVENMFAHFNKNFNSIDVLINNAGVAGDVGSIDNLDISNYLQAMDVNFYGSLFCIIEAIKSMKKVQSGKIINICGAGVGWDSKAVNKSAYISSKYALYGLTESLSRELKQFNVDINCVSPGSYDTDLRNSLVSHEKNLNAPQVLSAVGETLGALIKFLISDKSNEITGKILSAIYDTPDKLFNDIDNLKNTSDYSIRKIDKINYFRKET